jgi:CheY-specific phosphatase CheX
MTTTTSELNEKIKDMALSTFESMCFMFPMEDDEFGAPEHDDVDWAPGVIIRFDGDMNGGMLIKASHELRDAVTVNMLGDDDISDQQRLDACFELSNIICGNIVPLLTQNKGVSYIQSPRKATREELNGSAFKGFNEEIIPILLDEGFCEIRVYYM